MLKRFIEPAQIRSCIDVCKGRFDGLGTAIALGDIGRDDALESAFFLDTAFWAHVGQHGEFDLGEIEPWSRNFQLVLSIRMTLSCCSKRDVHLHTVYFYERKNSSDFRWVGRIPIASIQCFRAPFRAAEFKKTRQLETPTRRRRICACHSRRFFCHRVLNCMRFQPLQWSALAWRSALPLFTQRMHL